ncbi:MAG: MmgE/PrpD family protein [Actinobacteria bacterium]|nr:MmgE/PrpD family protein [Actinomycetota bacterium]
MEMGVTAAERSSVPVALVLADWARSIDGKSIPERVIKFASSQIASQIAAARATMTLPVGRKIVRAFGLPVQEDPKSAAYVLAALTMAADFDDTMYAGHVSHSTISVPLAYAATFQADGRTLLPAVVAANECAARITAAATLGPFRGQTAAHTHLAGSVAARMFLEQADAYLWASAWGIAFAAPPWTLDHPFFSGESKALLASTQVRAGLDACDAALGGLDGIIDIFEHPGGFLARYASVPLPEVISYGLGSLWHTETLSIKIYPGCAYIDSAVDCAVAIHHRLTLLDHTIEPAAIDKIVVESSAFTAGMDAKSAPYIDGPRTPLSALGFSVGYNVAVALTRGTLETADLAPESTSDPSVWELARKVHVKHDASLTWSALQATAPLGEALKQAGSAAIPWLMEMAGKMGDGANREMGDSTKKDVAGKMPSGGGTTENASGKPPGKMELAGIPASSSFGPPATSFQDATKRIGARVTVRFTDGHVEQEYRESAIGAIGPETRQSHEELARDKLLNTGVSSDDVSALLQMESLGAKDIQRLLRRLLQPA